MEQAKAPKYSFEYLKLADFELEEIFGGSPQELRYDSDKLKEYQNERIEQVAKGGPTFIVERFFGEGFVVSYFLEATQVAEILCDKRYIVDESQPIDQQEADAIIPGAYALYFKMLEEEPEEMSFHEAYLKVKEIGYPKYAKTA